MELRAAYLGGSAAALRAGGEMERKAAELEEMEREIEELRSRILANNEEIRGMDVKRRE